MTIELTMLAYSVAILIVLILIQAQAGVASVGLVPLANNRDNLPPLTGFAARMKRVVDNHREGLTVFAPLILIAAVSNISNHWTVLGAQLFFWSRLVHAILYVTGAPLIRPLAFLVGVAGTIMVFLTLIHVI